MSVLVGHEAPDFTAPAVTGDGMIVDDFNFRSFVDGKPSVLFFYPLDFTFVCPSEIIALDKRMDAFEARGVAVVSASIDSQFTHFAWRNTPVRQGGIGPVGYPMVADVRHQICQAYGIEHPHEGVALRASFLIDRTGIVRHQVVNDLPLGRNIDELLRMVDAMLFHEEHGDVCPAGWQDGDEGMEASAAGVADYLETSAEKL